MCNPIMFKPSFLNDFLCDNQALMRSDSLNAEFCSGTNKGFLSWTAFKSKTHPEMICSGVSSIQARL